MNRDHRCSEENQQFHPVILFHDYSYCKESKRHHVHIPYGDPYYQPLIQIKKERMNEMLKTNSTAWRSIQRHMESEDVTKIAPSVTTTATAVVHAAEPMPRLSTSSSSSSSSASIPQKHHSTPQVPSTTKLLQHGHYPPSSQYRPDHCYAKQRARPWHGRDAGAVLPLRKRRGNLPKSVTIILKHWLVDHCHHPYPTEQEKMHLGTKTGLTLNQISNWFINARRRILPFLLDRSQQSEASNEDSYENGKDDEDDGKTAYLGQTCTSTQDATVAWKPRCSQRNLSVPSVSV